MADQRIHHYTSVHALALILKSRQLRFKRVDQVDDVREAQKHSSIDFGKYFFVSCWTHREEESIPQWHLYTGNMEGVRITLPSYPFQRKRQKLKPGWVGESQGELYAPLSMEEQYRDSYFVLPMFLADKHFGGPVEYVEDIEGRYAAAIRVSRSPDGTVSTQISRPYDLVRLKAPEWSFQAEFRFYMIVLPSLPLPSERPGAPEFHQAIPSHVARCFAEGTGPGVDYIDVDLSQESLDAMEVTIGPLASAGARICVDAIVQRYAPRATVTESCLTGRIRRALR